MNFTHNFSVSNINLNQVSIAVSGNGILVNVSGQLPAGETKTLFLADSNYTSICVDDSEIGSFAEISTGCGKANEFKFTRAQCQAGTTQSGITCVLAGGQIAISGLNNSGTIGGTTVQASTVLSPTC